MRQNKKITIYRLFFVLGGMVVLAVCFFQVRLFAKADPLSTATTQTRETSSTSPAPAQAAAAGQPQSTSTDFLQSNQTLSSQATAAAVFPNGFNIQQLKEYAAAYFAPQTGIIEPTSGYAFEGYNQRDFTQPTALGFYGLFLANVATGDIATSVLSSQTAKVNLNLMMDSLLRDQKALGFKGLMPWLGFNGTSWQRHSSNAGGEVTLGDNVNLTASLAAISGGLAGLSGDPLAASIRTKIDTFLAAQKEGYDFLFDAPSGMFRQGWNFAQNRWVGGEEARADYLGDEFRGGILFVALNYGYPDTVYTRLNAPVTSYKLSTGQTLNTIVPFDGSAFQMLWPLLTMPETESAELNTSLRNFVRIALDYSKTKNLPGLLSASYAGPDNYAGNAGITALSYNNTPRNENVPSLYALGAARMIDPAGVDAFLNQIFAAHPGLISSHGLWEGIDVTTGQVIQEQVTANEASFLLGLAGTGPKFMTRYLQEKNLLWRLRSRSRAGMNIRSRRRSLFQAARPLSKMK